MSAKREDQSALCALADKDVRAPSCAAFMK
jgi:hypothetical protein